MKTSLIPLLLLTAAAAFAATDPAQLAAAKALYDARKFTEAEAAFKKLAGADPANAEVQYYLGISICRRGEFEDGAETIEKAIKLAPTNARYYRDLGEAYGQAAQKASVVFRFGLAKKCLAAYKRAAELEPENVDNHMNLFEYYRQAPGIAGGGTDKAEAEAANIVKLDPVRGHTAYVTLYAGDKKFDQALEHAAEVKKLDAARGRLAYAGIYTETKQYDKAFAEFDEALKIAPDDYAALYQVGKLAAISGQSLDRGLVSLRHCLELKPPAGAPSHAAAQWRIGNILEKKKDLAGARTAYEASLKIDPKFAQASDALMKLGRSS